MAILTIDLIQGIIEHVYPNNSTRLFYQKTVARLYKAGNQFNSVGISKYLESLNVCNSTKNNYRASFQSVANALFDEGLISAEACLKIKRVKKYSVGGMKIGRWLTKEQVAHVLNIEKNVIGVRDIALLSMLFATALRRSEVASIKWSNLNEMGGELFIESVRGKGNKYRRVIVQQWALPHLVSWHDIFVRQLNGLQGTKEKYLSYAELGDKFNKLDMSIFSSVYKSGNIKFKGMSGDSVAYIIEKRSRQSGVKFSPHDTRRTCAYLLCCEGVSIRIISHLLGHSSIATTQVYLQPVIESIDFSGDLFHI